MTASYLIQLASGLTGAIAALAQPAETSRIAEDQHAGLLVTALFRLSDISRGLAVALQTAVTTRRAVS